MSDGPFDKVATEGCERLADRLETEQLIAEFVEALEWDGHEPDPNAECLLCVRSARMIAALRSKGEDQ